jgi:hypothetical protein
MSPRECAAYLECDHLVALGDDVIEIAHLGDGAGLGLPLGPEPHAGTAAVCPPTGVQERHYLLGHHEPFVVDVLAFHALAQQEHVHLVACDRARLPSLKAWYTVSASLEHMIMPSFVGEIFTSVRY